MIHKMVLGILFGLISHQLKIESGFILHIMQTRNQVIGDCQVYFMNLCRIFLFETEKESIDQDFFLVWVYWE